jgi:hypothetical protein
MIIVTGDTAWSAWTDAGTELMLSDDAFFVGDAMTTPAYSITHCLVLVVVVVALAVALMFVLLRREPPRAKRSCHICGKCGHQKHCCPESPGYKVKKRRVRGPTKYVEGVHTLRASSFSRQAVQQAPPSS